jgi:hypothetical protein
MNDDTTPTPNDPGDGDTEPLSPTWIDPDLIDHGDAERVSRILVESFPPVPPDPGVWDAIQATIAGREQASPPVPASSSSEPGRWRPKPWHGILSIAAVLVLVVGAIAILSTGSGGDVAADGVVRELIDPATGQVAMTIAVATDGTSTATAVDLPALPADETYQLWSVVGDEIVSVGLLGHDPSDVPLRIEGEPTVLALTVEVSGGVAVSQAQPVAVWQTSG